MVVFCVGSGVFVVRREEVLEKSFVEKGWRRVL